MKSSPDIDTTSEVASRTAGSPSIVLSDVIVDRGRSTVLQVPHLEIAAGYTALVGPNGSGKSTMLHVIAGLLHPSQGSVRLLPSGTRDANVAYVLQSQRASEHLLVTAREVVRLARRRTFPGAASRAERVVVNAVMERLGILDLANRHLADMSGGQRQRVFIAQGLAQQADILLLDEPVAGLDLASEQTIRSAIDDERAAGRTVVVATHDLAEATRADRVVMLNGTVVASGPPAEVLRPENLRQAYRGRVLDLGDGSIAIDDDHHH
ncbi:MAG: metal ABC transporter ATP-binding protein [Ilumatobacter sp.]|uniref:metal ABC transporter ATP-binding protein n=1 Tax=Ilumatobacter sp. TaxID=1967498 RepID=UPI003297DA96